MKITKNTQVTYTVTLSAEEMNVLSKTIMGVDLTSQEVAIRDQIEIDIIDSTKKKS